MLRDQSNNIQKKERKSRNHFGELFEIQNNKKTKKFAVLQSEDNSLVLDK